MNLDLGSLPTPTPPDSWDWLTVLKLVYAGLGIAVMLFAVVRHHRHRRALRKHEQAGAETRKRPPAKVTIPPQREVRR
jgi:hypothetical protein